MSLWTPKTAIKGHNSKRPSSGLDPRELLGPKGGEPIVGLTAYTAPTARCLDRHIDFMLVGDSLAMVLYGMETTRTIDLDTMIRHGYAVSQAASNTLVVVDMPFGTYEHNRRIALENARRVMDETGCDAIKMEGGAELAGTVTAAVDLGIPVMGHIGLMPQRVKSAGQFKSKGHSDVARRRILKDALAIAEAGAFAIVIEGVVETVAAEITKATPVSTIGIGASAACDGQILVTEDMTGMFDTFKPKFVKRYAELGRLMEEAVIAYASDVRARRFPGPEHTFKKRAKKPASK
ncbi:MAG: 3-methyl-2-oxobutanoate hydroxymethyltransferase [Rhodospirillaceae bacterium]|nr:3-methyl-2-oxobutanoate hydroxymethyltransferase [Rhodospirillaceae bacterium]|tara:strand:+ start:3179 stop:4054 length:876 start_codon:yes stop_codon:yes gene_type:complete